MVSTQFISRVGLVLFFGLAATAIGAAIPGTESRSVLIFNDRTKTSKDDFTDSIPISYYRAVDLAGRSGCLDDMSEIQDDVHPSMHDDTQPRGNTVVTISITEVNVEASAPPSLPIVQSISPEEDLTPIIIPTLVVVKVID
ncbi:hypothetical protein PSHT_08434 [Puccinia striiformis]|uniref:Uncharacterized protein n=1 Tax=Puccinia striiformis TaxID=27350 RepID=A0A2S4VPU7_9BASI|nr:hypothetical protein PSHT_08434 [Puccinia striiformis]